MAEKVKVSEQILETKPDGNGASPEATTKPRKRKARRRRRQSHPTGTSTAAKTVDRPFPRVTLEDALKVAAAIKDKNGGNPYAQRMSRRR